jgi:hypothetical protein
MLDRKPVDSSGFGAPSLPPLELPRAGSTFRLGGPTYQRDDESSPTGQAVSVTPLAQGTPVATCLAIA